MRKNKVLRDIKHIIDTLKMIDKRTDKGDISFMCSELVDRIKEIEKEVLEDE